MAKLLIFRRDGVLTTDRFYGAIGKEIFGYASSGMLFGAARLREPLTVRGPSRLTV
jgi:hypothetical protein